MRRKAAKRHSRRISRVNSHIYVSAAQFRSATYRGFPAYTWEQISWEILSFNTHGRAADETDALCCLAAGFGRPSLCGLQCSCFSEWRFMHIGGCSPVPNTPIGVGLDGSGYSLVLTGLETTPRAHSPACLYARHGKCVIEIGSKP